MAAGSHSDIYGQQVTANGVISGSNQRLAGDGDNSSLYWPKVVSNGAGQFLVAWERQVSSSNFDIHAVRVAGSTGLAEPTVLNIDTAGGAERYPDVTGTSGGNYLLAWRDDGVIQAQVIPSSGTPGGSISNLSAATSGSRDLPGVVYSGSQALAVWTDNSQ
ncbi:MAG: hypothetical protein DPW09_28975 [Anaerolineae bacterium]|nr:hypothetical protein [Anaerolineales bacterium]MCQ3977482.1 hypothetical protein [Anaerolineae bacterium]